MEGAHYYFPTQRIEVTGSMSNNDNTQAKANNNGTRWKDYAEIYPPAKDIVEALQDLGKSMRLAHVQLDRVRTGSV